MKYHVACRDCVANHDCLFQNNDDAESCGDVQDFDSGLDLPDEKPKSSPDENGAGR